MWVQAWYCVAAGLLLVLCAVIYFEDSIRNMCDGNVVPTPPPARMLAPPPTISVCASMLRTRPLHTCLAKGFRISGGRPVCVFAGARADGATERRDLLPCR